MMNTVFVTKENGRHFKLHYERVESRRQVEEKNVSVFGIKCSVQILQGEDWVAGASETVEDISSYPERVEGIIQLLSRNQAFPTHVREIVEDLIAG